MKIIRAECHFGDRLFHVPDRGKVLAFFKAHYPQCARISTQHTGVGRFFHCLARFVVALEGMSIVLPPDQQVALFELCIRIFIDKLFFLRMITYGIQHTVCIYQRGIIVPGNLQIKVAFEGILSVQVLYARVGKSMESGVNKSDGPLRGRAVEIGCIGKCFVEICRMAVLPAILLPTGK